MLSKSILALAQVKLTSSRSLHSDTTMQIKINFPVLKGIKQGCILPLLLFNLYVEVFIKSGFHSPSFAHFCSYSLYH